MLLHSATTQVEDIVAALDADGAVIIERLVSEESCAKMTHELQPFLEATLLPKGG